MSVPHKFATPVIVVDGLAMVSWSAVVAVQIPVAVAGCINSTSSKSSLWMIKIFLKNHWFILLSFF